MSGVATRTVILSQRLGVVTDEERRLEGAGAAVRGAPLWSHDEIAEHGRDADLVILGAVEPFDATALDSLPRLGGVVRRGVGVDNIDVQAATARGIVVANVPDASVEEVSDHALALLLSLERGVMALDRAVRDGRWQRDPKEVEVIRAPLRRLSTLTLGIIGFGRIGRALHRKAAPIYGRVLVADPVLTEEAATSAGVELVPIDHLMATADHVSLHAPLLPETRHLVSARTLLLVRPDAILVNTSRGGLVDEVALVDALEAGRLRAVGLDVSEEEPIPMNSRLLTTDRVLLTAHSAASSRSTKVELGSRSVDAALALLLGERPASIVNPEVLEAPNLRLVALRD